MRGPDLLLCLAAVSSPAMAEPAGVDQAIMETIVSAMRVCWDDVKDLSDPQRLRVKIEILLEPDGSVTSVTVLEPASPDARDEAMSTAIDRALGAVERCAPFALPPEHYDTWKRLVLDFGPEPKPMI